ncbi:hypothetical protein [Bradyrhizobium sp. RT5a]|uniref:hypothetical protein n=1 Tax=Bradyrhizobium sp. RT5a TaxID=3156380 RepID=UPI00339B2FA0
MKSSVALGPSSRKIVARIDRVRKAAERAASSQHRFAEYKYLRSVLRAYRHFDDEDLLSHLMEVAPSKLMTPVRADWHPLRVIIEASCMQSDLKKRRSRWTRGLEYAIAENVAPEDLPRFFRAHNGIAGCADLASKIGRKRRTARRKKAPASKLFRQGYKSVRN